MDDNVRFILRYNIYVALFYIVIVELSFSFKYKMYHISVCCSRGNGSGPTLFISESYNVKSGVGISRVINSVGEISCSCVVVGYGSA